MTETQGAIKAAAHNVRVALLADRFPEPSQTFVFDQIDGLMSAGLSVTVHARARAPEGVLQDSGHRLAQNVEFAERTALTRALQSVPVLRKVGNACHARSVGEQYRRALQDSDLVLCNFGTVGLRAAEAADRLTGNHAPIWTIFHGYDISSYLLTHGERIYDPLFARGDRFLAISEIWAARLRELGCPSDRIEVLHMGVECEETPFVPRTSVGEAELRILFVGRLVEKKGTQYAIRALAQVAQEHPGLNWSFTIAGDGPQRDELETLTRKLRLEHRVRFLGFVSNAAVKDELARADLFLLPSVTSASGDMEGIPVSLMEAMAAGVPVISTVHSGIPELVDHDVSGLLAPERDVAALGRHIVTLLTNSERRLSLSRAARQKVERDFNQQKLTSKLAKSIFERVR